MQNDKTSNRSPITYKHCRPRPKHEFSLSMQNQDFESGAVSTRAGSGVDCGIIAGTQSRLCGCGSTPDHGGGAPVRGLAKHAHGRSSRNRRKGIQGPGPRSALINSGFKWPQSRITISLAPAELPKEGGGFDLPIALGILAASQQIPDTRFDDCEFLGELSLNGELRSVRGVLPAAIRSRDSNRTLVVPACNAAEAALVKGGEKYYGASLLEIANWINGGQQLNSCEPANSGKTAATARPLRRHRTTRAKACTGSCCGGWSSPADGRPARNRQNLTGIEIARNITADDRV